MASAGAGGVDMLGVRVEQPGWEKSDVLVPLVEIESLVATRELAEGEGDVGRCVVVGEAGLAEGGESGLADGESGFLRNTFGEAGRCLEEATRGSCLINPGRETFLGRPAGTSCSAPLARFLGRYL